MSLYPLYIYLSPSNFSSSGVPTQVHLLQVSKPFPFMESHLKYNKQDKALTFQERKKREEEAFKEKVFQLCMASWGRRGPITTNLWLEDKKNGVELMNHLINSTLYGKSRSQRLPVFCEICPDDESN